MSDPNTRPYADAPQLTFVALLLGALLSVVLAAANVYLGLLVGLTVSASIPAAVTSMAVLRLLRRRNLLENNIVQTAASAGEALAAGAIFTLPALIILEYWVDFDAAWVILITSVGGILGVLMTIPLRHALIGPDELPFPEGRATAAVLRAGHAEDADPADFRVLIGGVLAGAAVKLGSAGLKLWNGGAEWVVMAGKSPFLVAGTLSPALLGVGYIVGLNVAVLVFAGGAMAWFVGIPVLAALSPVPVAESSAAIAWTLWSTQIRYIGVGGMLVGGLWALWSVRRPLVDGLSSAVGKTGRRDDLPLWLTIGLLLILLVPMALLYRALLGSAAAIPVTLIMLVAAFVFSCVAAYMAGLVGSSNNPVSGVTIATILLTSLGLLAMGYSGFLAPVTAILVGAVVCCAAAIGGDSMQDLKAGQLLGATPWKQQVAQMVGVLAAVGCLAPVLSLLLRAYGIGPPDAQHPDSLLAPQADLMASVARGVFNGDLPWNMVAIGAAAAVAIIAWDVSLERRGSTFRVPVLAVAVGVYLPVKYSTPIAIGGLLAWWAGQRGISRGAGVLAAAGLITGEALMGIALAVPIVASGRSDVLALADQPFGPWPGIFIMVMLSIWLGRMKVNANEGGQT